MHCFVTGCQNNTRKTGSFFSYHSFPKDINIRKMWLSRIGVDHNYFIIHERICSEHFLEEDIRTVNGRRTLADKALPWKNLPLGCILEENIQGEKVGQELIENQTLDASKNADSRQSLPSIFETTVVENLNYTIESDEHCSLNTDIVETDSISKYHSLPPLSSLTTKRLSGEERANIVLEALKHLSTVDIKILALTCDGPHIHFKMMEALGCKIKDPNNLRTYFINSADNTPVHVIFDVCHMLKLIRNNWASVGTFIDTDGNPIKWKYIEKLHYIQKNENFYFANKSKEKHIKWKKAIMKVSLAAQCLSNSVADALKFLWEDCEIEEFKDVIPTVHFIKNINKIFDLLNSRNPFGKGMNTPLRLENEFYWKSFANEFEHYIKNLKCLDGTPLYATTRKVPILGFLVSIKSFLEMYEEEVKSNKSLKYMLTYKFSQDHLELFFCNVRRSYMKRKRL